MLKPGEPLNPNAARSHRDRTTASIWMPPSKTTEASTPPPIFPQIWWIWSLFALFSLWEKVSAAVAASGHRLILLQYELSAGICFRYSGTPNSIPPSCLILHNERLPAARRIMPRPDASHNCCTCFMPFQIFQGPRDHVLGAVPEEKPLALALALSCVDFRPVTQSGHRSVSSLPPVTPAGGATASSQQRRRFALLFRDV